jgi:FdhD protein
MDGFGSKEPGLREIDIVRAKDGSQTEEMDLAVVEMPLTIFINDSEFVTLLCSPFDLGYLAVGFLRSEGLIASSKDLAEVTLDQENGFVYVKTNIAVDLEEKLYGKRTITSGCGKGTVFFNVLDSLQSKPVLSSFTISSDRLLGLMREMQDDSALFKATGGVHSAAISGGRSLLFSSEDIGRHNAVDKIVGRCIMEDILMEDKILLTSGRLSSEIVIKGAKMGFPILVSRSAPTTLSVELATQLGITMVGFARGRRLNIYAHPERIDLSQWT